MIRPFTLLCFLLACGSGLYLYQSKHRVQMIDREIEKTTRATDALREQMKILRAEWALQGDLQRLQVLADQFLNLKMVTPGQFTSMAQLDGRLPAVGPPDPPPAAPQLVGVAQPAPEDLPPAPPVATPVAPPRPIAAAPPPRPPEHRSSPPPRPVVAEAQPVRPTPVAAPVAVARPTAAEPPRPVVPVAAPGPAVGSALGMARSASAPPPRPMPVSASQWVTNGGGG